MDTVFQVSAIAVITAVACLLLRGKSSELALLVSLTCVVLVLLLSVRFLSPVIQVFQRLRALSGMSDEVTAPMLKIAGIGLLTHITTAVCDDAGETAMSRAVSTSGIILSLYASLPLLSAVISLLEETLQ